MNKQADSLADALFLLLNALDGRHLTQGDINEARTVLTEYETKRNELAAQASQERQELAPNDLADRLEVGAKPAHEQWSDFDVAVWDAINWLRGVKP